MRNRRGFTIIELLIVIAVMAILLVLGVVQVSSSQAHARDNERKGDAETIATALENYYNGGNQGTVALLSYPSTDLVTQLSANNFSMLQDIDPNAVVAPSATSGTVSSVVAATNTNQTTTGVTPQPSSSNDVYVYQPLQVDGTLCTGTAECRKFNIFYYQESDSSVHSVTSRHQ